MLNVVTGMRLPYPSVAATFRRYPSIVAMFRPSDRRSGPHQLATLGVVETEIGLVAAVAREAGEFLLPLIPIQAGLRIAGDDHYRMDGCERILGLGEGAEPIVESDRAALERGVLRLVA